MSPAAKRGPHTGGRSPPSGPSTTLGIRADHALHRAAFIRDVAADIAPRDRTAASRHEPPRVADLGSPPPALSQSRENGATRSRPSRGAAAQLLDNSVKRGDVRRSPMPASGVARHPLS